MQLTLSTSASVVLDASGNGTVGIGPNLPGVSWGPSLNIAVSASTNSNEAQCNVYVGLLPVPGSLVAATSTGSTGDSTEYSGTVWPGQMVIAAWTGGDPGATATVSIQGTRTVPGGPP